MPSPYSATPTKPSWSPDIHANTSSNSRVTAFANGPGPGTSNSDGSMTRPSPFRSAHKARSSLFGDSGPGAAGDGSSPPVRRTYNGGIGSGAGTLSPNLTIKRAVSFKAPSLQPDELALMDIEGS
jgi:hypothetical protein